MIKVHFVYLVLNECYILICLLSGYENEKKKVFRAVFIVLFC